MRVYDPIQLQKDLWPGVTFYDRQREAIYSVRDNIETILVAGNMLGKDYVAAFIILWFFLTRHPCKVVTTSAKEDHLRVLWGEIGNFIDTSAHPLEADRGGNLIINQREIKKVVNGKVCKLSYIIGKVASADKIAAMQGHHIGQTGDGIPRTLFVPDECSSVPQAYYIMARTWFNRMLAIGNPWPCENFFKYAVKGEPGTDDKGGDLRAARNGYYDRKVFHICAEDSPNVRRAMAQIKMGKEPDDKILIPGVKPYSEYIRNRSRWNKVEQCVGLDARFYEGPELKMFPAEWLDRAEKAAEDLRGVKRNAQVIGVDSGEGGDNTSWVVADHLGIIHLISVRTPDTSVITATTLVLMRDYGVAPENVLFDMGGGGREHGHRLRSQGYNVRIIAFGGAATPEKKVGINPLETRKREDETRAAYKNRRVEMYYCFRRLLSPFNDKPFGIPKEYTELRRQLLPIPVQDDGDGKLIMPPKNKKDANDTRVTMKDLVGCSPDEADAAVLAAFGLTQPRQVFRVKSMV